MAPRKTRKGNSHDQAHGAQSKRARLESPHDREDHSQSHGDRQASDNEQVGAVMSGPTSQPTMIPWQAILESFEKEPLAPHVQRYKDWRKSGSISDTICRVCLQPGDLHPCHTCKPAFHASCIPPGSYHGSDNRLFCTICVRRGWHVAPPALTPPASPNLAPVQQPKTTVPVTSTMSIPSLITGLGSDGQQDTFPVQPVQATPATSLPPRLDRNHGPRKPRATPGIVDLSNDDLPNENTNSKPDPPRPQRKRKSRFTTLSSDVDASLSVLYRELESTASLKIQVEDLQSQNLDLLQCVKIRDNTLVALRRDLQSRKSADEELERLRASASSSDSQKKKFEELEAQNAQLRAELQASREETAMAQELVNDWKGKLAQLLNTS